MSHIRSAITSTFNNKKKKAIVPKFEVQHPLETQFFSYDFPKVNGKVQLEVIEPINVCSIELGFRGKFETHYRFSNGQVYIRRSETTPLFEEQTRLLFDSRDSKSSSDSSGLSAGVKFESKFNYDFPIELNLPSSCVKFGDTIKVPRLANIDILYQVFIRVTYVSSILSKKKTMEYTCNLNYQGGSNVVNPYITNCNISSSETFERKVKDLTVDPETDKLTENKVKDVHTKSRALRQVFNDDYKKENIDEASQSVPLELIIQMGDNFNVASSLMEIPLLIVCPNGDNKLFRQFSRNGFNGAFVILFPQQETNF
ncbi:unnamed protein product [Ambrosiozyma monospora]|uniref:Unnamed protein product n=1 Tax=Ambrosiozyma monospora TaxID=43982 RepID=A0ACB5U7Y5_AMBMO|nr:unnamed protein product [Ambrosiozyma monospora]